METDSFKKHLNAFPQSLLPLLVSPQAITAPNCIDHQEFGPGIEFKTHGDLLPLQLFLVEVINILSSNHALRCIEICSFLARRLKSIRAKEKKERTLLLCFSFFLNNSFSFRVGLREAGALDYIRYELPLRDCLLRLGICQCFFLSVFIVSHEFMVLFSILQILRNSSVKHIQL